MQNVIEIPQTGCARRVIDLRRPDSRTVIGWMEDDFHHFGVTIKHEQGKVQNIHMAAPRHPWTTCPGAATPLQDLIGKPLIARASDVGQLLDMRQQCTHVFDLTGLALAHAYHQRPRVRYQVITADRTLEPTTDYLNPLLGKTRSVLLKNDEMVMYFDIDNDRIIGPPEIANTGLNKGFRQWTETLDIESAEYAFILRRAILVAGGRLVDHDQFEDAAAMNLPALCHTYQPGTRDLAKRCLNSTRNYEQSPERMLLNVEEIP